MKTMRSMTLLIVCVCLGCAGGSAPNVLEVRQSGENKIEINDRALAQRIAFGEISLKRLEYGSEAQVILQNKTKRDVTFEYRFIWYDAAGFEVSALTAWIPATLSGGQSSGLKSTAPTTTAVDFKLMIRSPHPLTNMT